MSENCINQGKKNKILWFLLSVALVGIFIQGCAPRYLDKSPIGILNYPYVPVDAIELKNYKALVVIQPNSIRAAEAHYWIGQDAYNRQAWKEAVHHFNLVYERFPQSQWAPTAGIMAARTQVKLQKNLSSLALLKKILQTYSKPSVQLAAQSVAKKIINDDLTLAELIRIRASYPGTLWEEQALFVKGKRRLDQGQPDLAVKVFAFFITTYPKSEYVNVAAELIKKATRIIPINRNKIGCLLPLSGRYAPYGKTIKQGLDLALEQLNMNKSPDERLGLIVVDTKGTTSGAVAGLLRLRDIEKVLVIIGPTLSNAAKALVQEMNRHVIPVITTSAAEKGLPELQPYLFRYMLTNQEQGAAMAEYMVLRKNLQRIGILSGEAAYDRSLADAFEKKLIELGGEVVSRMEYRKGTTDFKSQMLTFGGLDPGKLKDLKVKESKQLGKIVETIAFKSAQLIAPQPEKVIDKETAVVPKKRVAIIRFNEYGSLTIKNGFGKKITEKLSYALASAEGVKVIKQSDTFKGLRKVGLSPVQLERYHWKKAGAALDVDYIVVGKITQPLHEPAGMPGEPIPVQYNIEIKLVECSTGRQRLNFDEQMVVSIAPERNIKDMEALYLPIPIGDAILAASQLEFYDLKVPVFGCDAWLTSQLMRQGRNALEKAIFIAPFWADNPAPRSMDFVKQYEQRFSSRPTVLAAQSYDALWLVAGILKRMKHKSTNRTEFKKTLMGIQAFNGITGRAIVEHNGEIRREPFFLQMKNGNLRRVR